MRIGLLGGSFDPIHIAHVALGKAALKSFELDEVQLLPARQPWQKAPLSASEAQRLVMIELAIADEPGLTVNSVELSRPGKTFTIDTLEQLPEGPTYFWLLGADQLENFCTWHRWEDIAKQVTLLVAARPGASLSVPTALQALVNCDAAKIETLPFDPIGVSSTELRTHLKTGVDVDHWLHPAVAKYIKENGLYR